MKNFQKKGITVDKSSSNNEEFLISMLKQLSERLQTEYEYTNEELLELLSSEIKIPLEIFSLELAPSESLVKYLKENLEKTFHEIAELTSGNERAIWASYQRANKKMSSSILIENPTLIPLSIFSNKKLSVLETVVVYLKEKKKMKGVKIAQILKKHPANIWTIYNRANEKITN